MRLRTIVILLVSLGFIGWVFYALRGAEPVKVMETQLKRDGGQVFVMGKLQNSGTDTGPVDIEVRYFDAGGHAVGQDKIVVDKLQPGVLTQFQTPHRTIDGAESFSLYLNHGRNPYGN
jgi:hypothetical protein